MKWLTCCKGRSSCPQIAVTGKAVHIKDDYGNQIVMSITDIKQLNFDIASKSTEIRLHGNERKKPPVRMTIEQFYLLLETLDKVD